MPRNGSFRRLPIDTSPPQRAPEWEAGALKNNLIWKDLGCTRMAICKVKAEIPAQEKAAALVK